MPLNASFFSTRAFISSLWLSLGLLLGFWMDYSHGRSFGMGMGLEISDAAKYSALAVSFGAFLFFSRKRTGKTPHAGLLFCHPFKALASLVIVGFLSYCLLPSTARNTVFKWGITSFLRDYPGDAAILRKYLTEKKPDPAKALPSYSMLSGLGEKWQTDLRPLEIVFSRRCSTLIIKGHFRYVVGVFLDSVDEATAKQIVAEDVSRISAFDGRPLFSATACGVTLVWEDITS